MLLEFPWEVLKKMGFLDRGGADMNWNSPLRFSKTFNSNASLIIFSHK